MSQDDEEDDDFPQVRAGLVGDYIGADGGGFSRIDPEIAFSWGRDLPDWRLAKGDFVVLWRGRLFAIEGGIYRLHVFASGTVHIELNDETVLYATTDGPGWLATQPVKLEFGYHPITISYRHSDDQARIALYWEGPQFQLEPVSDRYLFHDPQQAPKDGARFERGRSLVRALRCAGCHELPRDAASPPGSDLTRLGGNINREWLHEFFGVGNHHQPAAAEDGTAPSTWSVPHDWLEKAQAEPLMDRLLEQPKTPDEADRNMPQGDRTAGERLFRTIGCLACHRVGDLGSADPFGGGNLSAIGDKRPADFFAPWLTNPERTNPQHRMPVFRLSPEEVGHLANYLASLHESDKDPPPPATGVPKSKVARPTALNVSQLRCAGCHKLPESLRSTERASLLRGLERIVQKPGGTCLDPPEPNQRRPAYRLNVEDRAAIKAYLTAYHFKSIVTKGVVTGSAALSGSRILEERNCIGCHARGAEAGLVGRLPELLAAEPGLVAAASALVPPSLNGVGDKLHEAALATALKADKPLRPWLAVRMPRFSLSEDERAALSDYFTTQDRIPPGADVHVPALAADETAQQLAGRRLVTADGFGCTSCHTIGTSVPRSVAINARGTDLTMLQERIRRPWFDRWVRNPARIVPRMEMPSIKLPVRGVLADRLDDQLAGVWSVLNLPGFDPPPPNPIRVVRHRGNVEDSAPADVLTDVFEAGPRVFIKPLVIGLSNRHNVLIDLAENRLAGWWLGDTARQRTRGKSWYWEIGGTPLWPLPTAPLPSEFALLIDGRVIEPAVAGQFPTELDWVKQTKTGVRFGHRLHFALGIEGKQPDLHLTILQSVTEISGKSDDPAEIDLAVGFRRTIEVKGLPKAFQLLVRFFGERPWQMDENGKSLSPKAEQALWRIESMSDARFQLNDSGLQASTAIKAAADADSVAFECRYTTSIQADQYLVPGLPLSALPAARLHVVPGFEAVQLPLPQTIMPTGLAWRQDGTMLLTSLKGDVLSAVDSDGDGLQDQLTTFADGLAAPYGLAIDGEAVDVINKHSLLRLTDQDGDGRADRWDVAASGWGHTADYHDWAIGLPRDKEGRYHVGLPCQQDDRSAAAAYLRGTTVRLTPRQPTRDNPRRFSLEPWSAGLRFPMGLALNRAGELFGTDNQGNYTPFNELNHLLPGVRYGFINKLETKPGFSPPFQAAAIEIPHPWTRSVNGICFLDTPDALRNQTEIGVFGPFEGHLIGCEYDSRRLVRMSLERVAGTWQGAVYPFSVVPDEGDGFEGPVVCAVSPAGDLFIGNMRDSGWGAGTNTGSLVRLHREGPLPLGLAEIRALPSGFRLLFTGPVNAKTATQLDSYAVESYRRIATPAYGGPDMDRRAERVRAVELAPDRRSVELRFDELRPGFVYEFRIKSLGRSGEPFHPAEGHYTLRVLEP